MTKKEFKRAMCCGLGRCVQELERTEHIETYREIVRWGCMHRLAYDTQCEGTRGWYLYRLAKCFPDEDFFVKKVRSYFYKSCERAGWAFDQYCDFLGMFAGDGNVLAHEALWTAYKEMYEALLVRKRRSADGSFPLFDNFESLCIALVNTEDTWEGAKERYFQIVEDVGNLMRENSLFETWSFDWFQACWENQFGEEKLRRKLEELAKESEGIGAYTSAMYKQQAEWEAQRARRRGQKQQARVPGTGETLQEKENFSADAGRDTSFTDRTAAAVPDGRKAQPDLKTEDRIYMLTENYRSEDHDRLVSLVKSLPVTYEEEAVNWHGPYMAVLDLLEKSGVEHPPEELLPYMYEHALCSFCRESMLQEMRKRGMLTEEILKECLYDCNDEIRAFARGERMGESQG